MCSYRFATLVNLNFNIACATFIVIQKKYDNAKTALLEAYSVLKTNLFSQLS